MKEINGYKKYKIIYEFISIFPYLLLLATICIVIWYYSNVLYSSDLWMLVILIMGLTAFFIFKHFIAIKFNALNQQFKLNVIGEILKQKYPNLKYNLTGGFDDVIAFITQLGYNTDLSFTGCKTSDYIHGDINDLSFKMNNIIIYNRYLKLNLYQGRVFQYAFKSKFPNNLILSHRLISTLYYLGGGYRIKSESKVLNKKFAIRADNASASQMLSPNFIKQILKMEKRYKHINFEFFENHLMIYHKVRYNPLDIYCRTGQDAHMTVCHDDWSK